MRTFISIISGFICFCCSASGGLESAQEIEVSKKFVYVMVKSREDQKFFWVVGPGHGVFEVELINPELKKGLLVVRVLKVVGLNLDLDADGVIDMPAKVEGSIVRLGRADVAGNKIHEIDSTYYTKAAKHK